MYAKLIDGNIELAPQNKGAIINYNANIELMVADGYKEFIQVTTPDNTNRKYHIEYTESAKFIKEIIVYEETQAQADAREKQEKQERIGNLSMTRGDVFEAIILAKNKTKPELRAMIENYPGLSDLERALYLNRFDEALDFYRKHPAIDLIGGILDISTEQMNRFFETKDWHELTK